MFETNITVLDPSMVFDNTTGVIHGLYNNSVFINLTTSGNFHVYASLEGGDIIVSCLVAITIILFGIFSIEVWKLYRIVFGGRKEY